MQFFNSRSGKKENFTPLNPEALTLYVCGPTVYDVIHLGNARPLVVFDVLYRLLSLRYPQVTYVRNITDLDDKIYQRAAEKNISIDALTQNTIIDFTQDYEQLRCLPPTHQPKATEHIAEMIALIENLLQRDYAYQAEGHVLFSHQCMCEAFELLPIKSEQLLDGARVEIAPYKRDARDFILWKPTTGKDNCTVGWDSPFGFGRPGWHIECSAMALKYLGKDFDIHGGGQDLLFPHHYNEYAQSCAAHPDHQHARYWLHNGYVLANGEKMSKSLGNFYTVQDLLKQYDGETIRLMLLMTHYRQPLDFSFDKMAEAKNILDKFYQALRDIDIYFDTAPPADEVIAALADDLNSPLALQHLHHIAKQLNHAKAVHDQKAMQAHAEKLIASANLLGLLNQSADEWFAGNADENEDDISPQQIETLIIERRDARKQKDFARADEIRDMLTQQGILLEDTEGKTLWKKS